MTDREQLIAMFERAEITYTDSPNEQTLVVEAGYVGFFTYFEFHDDGRLKSVTAWE